MGKHVGSGFLLDKAKAFGIIEPFNSSSSSRHSDNPNFQEQWEPSCEGHLAGIVAFTYEEQDEVLNKELRNGVHKYQTHIQATRIITERGHCPAAQF
jgi:hypothetical protein